MKAEIITIGDEILIGQIADTNSQWMAHQLNDIGVEVVQISTISDSKTHIDNALNQALQRAEIVLITGGLGPTKDDVTKLTLANYFEDELEMNEAVKVHIIQLFKKINYQYTEADLQQAMLPKKASVLLNHLGTASGMWFERDEKIVVAMPGVPNEMKGLMTYKVLPRLQKELALPFILHHTVTVYGIGESNLAKMIASWENLLPAHIKLAYLPSYGRVRLRLSTKGWEKEILELEVGEQIKALKKCIAHLTVVEDLQIEDWVHEALINCGKTLAVAESCTGGALAELITQKPGASQFFLGGVVSYSAKAKEELLRVKPDTIAKHSVVSEAVVKEMALGCKAQFNCDYAIAITGNAGPTKDKTDLGVGEVFIALASEKGVKVLHSNFGQPREKVIKKSVVKALEMLKSEILKNTKK